MLIEGVRATQKYFAGVNFFSWKQCTRAGGKSVLSAAVQ
jgi:hypothetical protein